MRIVPVGNGMCRKATSIVEASGIELTSRRIWQRSVALACALLVAAAAMLVAAPRFDHAAGSLDAVAVGSLAIQDGQGDIATMLVRQLAVEAGDGKRLPADEPDTAPRPSEFGIVPGVSAHVGPVTVPRPCVADTGLLASNRIPTGPPAA